MRKNEIIDFLIKFTDKYGFSTELSGLASNEDLEELEDIKEDELNDILEKMICLTDKNYSELKRQLEIELSDLWNNVAWRNKDAGFKTGFDCARILNDQKPLYNVLPEDLSRINLD